ncbi:MAG: phage virion morphogenesis protein [Candidatus Dechloromonas phosphoritropha]|jgi:phage virion morphogenesis protein
MSLIVTVNSAPLREVLDRLHTVTNDLSPVMEAIGGEMETRIRGRFETQSDPLGAAWTTWMPSTVKTYPKDGNKRMLDRHGHMLRSLSHVFDAHSATVGFGQPYAADHEFGTKKMVRRGLLFADPDAGTLAPDDEAALLDIVTRFLDQAID